MKKTVIFAMICSLLLSMVQVGAHAEEFDPFVWYYDFNDYEAALGSGIGPDSNWRVAYMQSAGSYIVSEKRKKFGSYVDSDGAKVMRVAGQGEPVLLFKDMVDSGSLHVSFDIKFKTIKDMYQGFYDSHNYPSDSSRVLESNYSIGPWFKRDNKIYYSYKGAKDGDDMCWTNHWKAPADSGLTFKTNTWHHVDMCFGDYGSNDTAIAKYYIDGQLINQNDVYFKGCGGFKALYFRDENSEFYLDNVYVSSFQDNEYLHGFLENDVLDKDTKSLRLKLSEPLNGAVTNEDVIITNAQTGEEVTDFTVTSDSDRYVDITVNEELAQGRYNLILKDNVTGAYYNNPMWSSVTFRTPPRYVDDVLCPDVEKVSYINYKGREQSAADSISTATDAVKISFSTEIMDADIMDNIKLLNGDEECGYDYMIDGKNVALKLNRVLEPDTEYRLSISGNVSAADSASATMGLDYEEQFKTLSDELFDVVAEDIEKGEGGETYFKAKLVKTDYSDNHKYTYAQAAYKKHTVTGEDGSEKTYLEMTALNRIPVIVPAADKMIMYLGEEQPINAGDADMAAGYIWLYPDNSPIVTKSLNLK
ncbi:MAG: hypothetical protein PUF72_01610 [Clostridiales bacterium]|nr:hypothetical protein [Clostridiales bacterium]